LKHCKNEPGLLERLKVFESGRLDDWVLAVLDDAGAEGRELGSLVERLGVPAETLRSKLRELSRAKTVRVISETPLTAVSGTAFNAILKEIAGTVQDFHNANPLVHGISKEELMKTEERVHSQMQFTMDSPLAMANWFGTEELLIRPGKPDRPEIQAQKVHHITPEDVSTVIQDIFVPQKRNLVVVGPTGLWGRKRVRKLLD